MSVLDPIEPRDAHPPDNHPTVPSRSAMWAAVIGMALVLGCATLLLLTGFTLEEALVGAGGMAMIGGQVARRITADAGPLPTVIVGSTVTAFGAVLISMDYSIADAALGAGVGGLLAGEMAGHLFGRIPRPWRGV
jgi:hypothetical protein